jgi:hypothetical protein
MRSMSEQLRQQLSAAPALRAPMPRALRTSVYALCGLLWVSGVAWLSLHLAFPSHNEFGTLPNPWEAPVLRVHGLLAVAGVFLLGWLMAAHVGARWGAYRNRPSGVALLATALVLVASGYALYYSTGALHEGAARVHEWLGALAILAGFAHWWRQRAARGTRTSYPEVG